MLSSVVTNNGTLILVRQDFGPPVFGYTNNIVGTGRVVKDVNNFNQGEVLFVGTNTYTGGTIIADGGIILGDGVTPGAGSIVGDVIFTNSPVTDTLRTLQFNRPEGDDVTFSGNIIGAVTGSPVGNSGVVIQNGFNAVTLTGNNTYTGGTTINAGTLQVGNGGTSGSIGTGNTANESMLVFNRSDNVTYDGVIRGAGSVVQQGSGTLMLNGVNTYTGLTTVSNGMFGGTGTLSGPVTLEAGTTLAPGAPVGSVGTLMINSDLSIGGNLAIEVNKSLSPSNDLVVVSGLLTKTGTGTLTVANLGPALAVGDKFALFSQPVVNGAALTVTGGGATWTNNLAVDGSIQVLTVTMTQQPHIVTPAVSGAGLVFSGTNGLANGGYQILSSTNVAAPLSSWTQIASGAFDGSGKMSVTNAINLGEPQRFFLLRLP